jgi:hypothetical protein
MSSNPPGPPGPYPAQPPYPPMHPQQYPPGQWGPPPKKSNGALIAVLVVVAVLVLGGGGFFLYTQLSDDSEAAPKIDTSEDLDEAPMGCALFTEAEVAPYIPGRMEFEPTGFGTTTDLSEQDQCDWGNHDTWSEDGVRASWVIVTSYLYHARINNSGYDDMSGVDVAKEEADRQARTGGGAVDVPGADDARLVTKTSDSSAKVVVRYHNVVYVVDYTNQTEGANIQGAVVELATIVTSKVVPDENED